jgi:hypothetical protein
MVVAIRKEPEGYIYIDKTFLERFSKEQLGEYGYTLVEVDDKYFDCEGFDFNDDLTFNVEKYNARIQAEDDKSKVANLQMKLDKTDYVANKLAEAITEYIVTEDKTKLIELHTKYTKELADREEWRKEVNDLQDKLKALEQRED